MEMPENLRGFGFCEVNWTVKHFFGATTERKWVIPSPDFVIEGKVCTSWRLCLKENYVDEKYVVCVYLESMNHSFEEPIWVTWKLFSPDNMDEKTLEVESDFESNSACGIEISQDGELEKIMERKDKDTLLLKSMIFVSAKDSQVQKRSSNPNLKALSQDMTMLYRVIKNRDLKLLVGGYSVKVHRGILSSRSAMLKAAIAEEETVTFPELDTDAAKSVLGYLYTSNLDYVIRKPTFSIMQCIKDLDLTQLEDYYKPDCIELLSKFKMETCKIEFVVPAEKIENQREIICLPSAESGSNIKERIFTLNFYPKGTSDEANYMSVWIQNMECSFFNIAHCEVGVIDTNGKCRNVQRKRCCNYDDEVKFEKFLPSDSYKNSEYTSDGNLRLFCKLYVSNTASGILTTTKDDVVYYDIVVDPEKHYKMLSYHLALLFHTRAYCDFTLTSNDVRFPVHSYILSARSYVFRNLLTRQFLENKKSMDLSSIRSDVLKSVLMYMYCGVLLHYERDDLIDIYEVAERFLILPLKYECSKRIQDNLEDFDAETVLRLAVKYKDYKLQSCVRSFMSQKKVECENSVVTENE